MPANRLTLRKNDALILLLYSSFIFYLPFQSQVGTSLFGRIPIPQVDKVFHALEYGLLGYLWIRSLRNAGLIGPALSVLPYAILICMMYAFVDEYIQHNTPHRVASAGDLVADGFGALCGVVIHQGLWGRKPNPTRG